MTMSATLAPPCSAHLQNRGSWAWPHHENSALMRTHRCRLVVSWSHPRGNRRPLPPPNHLRNEKKRLQGAPSIKIWTRSHPLLDCLEKVRTLVFFLLLFLFPTYIILHYLILHYIILYYTTLSPFLLQRWGFRVWSRRSTLPSLSALCPERPSGRPSGPSWRTKCFSMFPAASTSLELREQARQPASTVCCRRWRWAWRSLSCLVL